MKLQLEIQATELDIQTAKNAARSECAAAQQRQISDLLNDVIAKVESHIH